MDEKQKKSLEKSEDLNKTGNYEKEGGKINIGKDKKEYAKGKNGKDIQKSQDISRSKGSDLHMQEIFLQKSTDKSTSNSKVKNSKTNLFGEISDESIRITRSQQAVRKKRSKKAPKNLDKIDIDDDAFATLKIQ